MSENEAEDIFISHSWASGGRSKYLSLLLQSGCNMALIFWFMGYFGRKEATFAYLVHPLRVPESFFPQIAGSYRGSCFSMTGL